MYRLMDSRIGLDYIVDNKEYTKKLATALDTSNVGIKKQVFELLSSLCIYNGEGYQRALDALEHFKTEKQARYRFKVVVDELRTVRNLDYLTAVVSFINCVIISATSLQERMRIRNEFIGLKLLDVLSQLRMYCTEKRDCDLSVQLDLFDEQKYTDEGQCTGPSGVDLSSHLDVFYAILRQIAQTPQEIPFLSVLQHLLRVDTCQPISDIIWDTAEKLVHRATLCETKEDTEKLLRTPSYHHSLNKLLRGLQESGGRCMCSCHSPKREHESTEYCGEGRVRKRTPLQGGFSSIDGSRTPGILSPTNSSSAFSPELLATLSRAISPPPVSGGGVRSVLSPPPSNCSQTTPPPLPSGVNPPPPPPPPPPLPSTGGTSFAPPPPPLPGCPPPPPPPPPGVLPPKSKMATAPPELESVRLPQQFTPKPKNKMKSLNWNKIPSNKVVGKTNLWSLIAKAHDGSRNDFDFETMESLFCQQSTLSNGQQSPRLDRRDKTSSDNALDRRKKESVEINLLDGKRSLNVNIFLKQFRCSNEEIIRLLKDGIHEDIGVEKLRGLLKVLPESDEVELLRGFTGDRQKLGNAEKFLMRLIYLPNYKLRCEGLLLKEEFASNMAFLEPALESIVSAVQELKLCGELHEVLYMLLVAGNFLNSGGYAGDAAGFKMMSLLKITDTRANKPGMNLIHYVAQEAEKKFPKLLEFPHFLPSLEEASKLSIDNLKSEIGNLNLKVTKITEQVLTAAEDIKHQMQEFLQLANAETRILQRDIDGLEKVREEMANFLCEDLQSFKLEDCFKTFYSFSQKFKAAIEENAHRKQQEKRAEARRRQRQEQLAMKKKNQLDNRPPSYSGSESDHIMDVLLGDIQSGFSPNRFADQNFKGIRSNKKLDTSSELCRMNSLNSSLPSEEEVTNSPRVVRRRIGSLSSVATNGEFGDVESPDITPNGTLRRRRNRLSSDDHEDNLMDFLRSTAEAEHSRGDKLKPIGSDSGSLDRSLLRKSSRRRRADLLSSDLLDRERPASPISPQIEAKIDVQEPETHRPRQWRKKIEDWLHENEKEQQREKKLRDRINLEKMKRREQEQRDSDSLVSSVEGQKPGKNLETLHEAKTDSELYANRTRDALPTINLSKAIDKSEGSQLKDKSRWRKSTLNVANSSESIDDERRRNRNRKSIVDLDSSANDTITLYLRTPEEIDYKSKEMSVSTTEISDLDKAQNKPDRHISKSSTELSSPAYVSSECNKTQQDNFKDKGTYKDDQNLEQNSHLNIGKSRFYHSMREPSFHKVEEDLKKTAISDDENLCDENKSQKTETTVNKNEPTTCGMDVEDEGNFDRFSFMRKTTRRTKPRQKSVDRERKNTEIATIQQQRGDANVKNDDSTNSTPDYIEGALKDIDKASQEIQSLNESSSIRGQGGLYTKNQEVNVKVPESAEEAKKRDRSTSLKARLSRRLQSLSENFKGKQLDNVEKFSTDKESQPLLASCQDNRLFNTNQNSSDSLSYDVQQKKPAISAVSDAQVDVDRPDLDEIKGGDEYRQISPILLPKNKISFTTRVEPVSPASTSSSKSPSFTRRVKDEQEKDEGFEETQSQLSEAASQGPFSSYDTDSVDSPETARQIQDHLPTDSSKVQNKSKSTVVYPTAEKTTEKLPQMTQTPRKATILGRSFNSPSRKPLTLTLGESQTSRKTPARSASSAGEKDNRTNGSGTRTRGSPLLNKKISSKESNNPELKNSRERINGTTNRIRRGSSSILNEPIKQRVAAYTRAIRNMTNNLNKSGKILKDYDVTQSMPPTPSEENKTFLSGITKSGSLSKSPKTRSNSSVNSNKQSQRKSSEKSLSGSSLASRPGSRRSSEKSIDRLSRRSSEASVVTVKSASNKNGHLPNGTKHSTLTAKPFRRMAQNTNPRSPVMTPKSVTNVSSLRRKVSKISDKEVAVVPPKQRAIVRRTSSDVGTCSFMKATSSSSAKMSPLKTITAEPKIRSKVNNNTLANPSRVDFVQNKLKQR